MNNNRSNNNNSNNRRRGRGNRQQGGGGGGGGQQLNRIDSRARGNAPQLLEKYRKLAHDAHLNGDRVQEEYYLQFADHYFRVLADQRARQEEQRGPRPEQRWQEGGESGNWRDDGDGQSEDSGEGNYQSYNEQPQQNHQRPLRQAQDDRGREDRYRDERPAAEPRREARSEEVRNTDSSDQAEPAADTDETAENPFVREPRPTRGLRPRREPRPAQEGEESRPRRAPRADREPRSDDAGPGLDPSLLPPAIAVRAGDDAAEQTSEEAGGDDRPRRRPRRPRPPAGDAGEALEAVN